MEFFTWHYTKGLEYYIRSWKSTISWISHYFSATPLLKTLFSPWKRLIVYDRTPGFSLQKAFSTIMFNLISRGIGAIVRFILLFVGIILTIFTFLAGLMGIFFWLLFPFFGFGVYRKYKRQPKHFIENLMIELRASSESSLKTIFGNDAGKFVLSHVGIEFTDLVDNAREDKVDLKKFKPKLYEEIIKKLVESEVWTKEYFDKRKVRSDDLILASSWWDKKRTRETQIEVSEFGHPGIASDLTFGYTPTLNQYCIDLSIPQPFSHRLIGRQLVVSQMERTLTSGNSVVLIGQPGVGKKTVVLEFAHRATTGQLGPKMAYKRVLEFDYNALLSEAADVSLKKTKLSEILAEAAYAGNIILMIRDIQRLTSADIEEYDFTDVFEEYLEKRNLKIIAVSTHTDYERFIAPNLRLRKFLKRVEVTPPTKEEALQILVEAAQKWESEKNITITVPVLRYILEESDRYVTEVPYPEKALELVNEVITYCEQKSTKIVKLEDAKLVLSEKIGVSFVDLTSKEKKRLENIEDIIHERLINQDAAVELIGKTLRAKTVGVIKEDRPLGSFLFLGPTGVGKTETAKVLASEYFGSEENILRFDMAEYSGKERIERLIGSVSKSQPGVLTTAIKNKPASLLLLDEIEKATSTVYNLFLTVLDEGVITDASGKKIICRHLFVIGTSNAGAEYIRQQVNSGVGGEQLQENVVNHVQEQKVFSPEFLNRFDGVVVFEPLKKDDLVKIAHLMLSDLAGNLRAKNIYLQDTDEVAQKLAVDGFDPAFGARPMRRIVNLVLGDLIGKSILKGEIKEGDRIKIIPEKGKEEFAWEKVK
jgi:ATP-dependent Clp protease ATP-binding subunit ClpA